jgi:hypothetical protein
MAAQRKPSLQQTDTAGKRLELLREVVPNLGPLAIMANAGAPGAVLEMREVDATARALHLQAITREIRQVEDIASAIDALKGRADALYVATDRSYSTIVFGSTPWRRMRDCQRFLGLANMSMRELYFRTALTGLTCSGALLSKSIRYYAPRNPPTSRQTIGSNHQYPDGFVLSFGTMFAPTKDRDAAEQGFTHKTGDIVTIASAKLGSLTNRMRMSNEC